jgi:hypothetical protein
MTGAKVPKILPKSHARAFARALEDEPGNKLSMSRLATKLGADWTVEKVREKTEQFELDGLPLAIVKGGVQYFGTELSVMPGLYREIARGIERSWARDSSIPGPEVRFTFRSGTKGDGDWTRPDLVLVSHRKAGPDYHSIEAEQPSGFGIQSVYQAYEQGRGAHFSWVFFHGREPTGTEWVRILAAAKDLRVGLVHVPKPVAPKAWKIVRRAGRRDVRDAEHASFLRYCAFAAEVLPAVSSPQGDSAAAVAPAGPPMR